MDFGNSLLCCENVTMELDIKCKSYLDPVLLKDNRILESLLNTEEKYMPSPSYFTCVQTDVEPRMREIVAHWMLNVCHEEERAEEVFALAMNLLDRFLSLVPMKRQHLQLLGTVCLLLSSKLKESSPLDPNRLVHYGDGAFILEDLRAWELVVLSRLKWDLSAITPHAFLDQILERLRLDLPEEHKNTVRDHASFFIKVCATDSRFTSYTPSMVAAAAVASAVQSILPRQFDDSLFTQANDHYQDSLFSHPSQFCQDHSTDSSSLITSMDHMDEMDRGDLNHDHHPAARGGGDPVVSMDTSCHSAANSASTSSSSSSSLNKRFMQSLYHRLHSITQIDTDCLRECHRQIEIWTRNNTGGGNTSDSPTLSVTPTDVQDVVF